MSKDKKKAPEAEVKEEQKAAEEEIKEEQKAEEAEAPEKEKAEEKKEEKAEEKKEEKKPAYSDDYLRLLAEYDNYRKRTSKEKSDIYTDVKVETLRKFLPVYDNLERALAAQTEDEAYRKGVEMIMTQFKDTMDKLGVKEIESLGKTFDPNLHNAVMHVDDETKGENEIVDVFQKGFILGEKVVRVAMVRVAN